MKNLRSNKSLSFQKKMRDNEMNYTTNHTLFRLLYEPEDDIDETQEFDWFDLPPLPPLENWVENLERKANSKIKGHGRRKNN